MRVLIADDQPKVRYALQVLLNQENGMNVVGEVAEAEDLLALAEATRPDVVLFDWGLPGAAAPDLLSALRTVSPGLWVIVLSAWPGARQAALSLADAFVSKADPPEKLLNALRSAKHGNSAVSG
jgi:DNA-binding NarL/FixJ family response regulator